MSKIIELKTGYKPNNLQPKEEENRVKKHIEELLSELNYRLAEGFYNGKLDEDLFYEKDFPAEKGKIRLLQVRVVEHPIFKNR